MDEDVFRFFDCNKFIKEFRANLKSANEIVIRNDNFDTLQKITRNILQNVRLVLRIDYDTDNVTICNEDVIEDLETFIEAILSRAFNLHERTNDFEFFTLYDLLIATISLCLKERSYLVAVRLHNRILTLCNVSLKSWVLNRDAKANGFCPSLRHCIELLIRLFSFFETLSVDERYGLTSDVLKIDNVKQNLILCLSDCGDIDCVRIAIELLPKIAATNNQYNVELWRVIARSFSETGDDFLEIHRNGLLLLSCTADLFFDKDVGTVQIWTESIFWKMIQYGLMHADTLNRKRSIYVLKRALESLRHNTEKHVNCETFAWNHSQSEIILTCYENIMFVLETLEEKQVHLITPLFPIVRRLIEAATMVPDNTETIPWSLHSSWVVVVLQQMLRHDSKTVRRWTVDTISTIDFIRFPLLQQNLERFLLRDFLIGLNDASLYTRHDQTSSQIGAAIEEKLISHLNNLLIVLRTLEIEVKYFRQFLRNLHSQIWSSVPLFYVVKVLSSLPPTKLWNRESLDDIKELLLNTIRTHDTFVRGATQEFLLRALINLIDTETLTLEDVSSTLLLFKKEESLCRGTELWNDVVQWLRVSHFRDTQSNFIVNSTRNILNVKTDTNGILIPTDDQEIQRVAKMIVLLMDYENCPFTMDVILKPFVQVLETAHRRPYMANETVEAALKFTIALYREMETATNDREDDFGRTFQSNIAICASEFMNYLTRRIHEQLHNISNFENCEVHFEFFKILIQNKDLHFALRQHFARNCEQTLSAFGNVAERLTNKIVAVNCFLLAFHFVEVSDGNLEDFHAEKLMKILIETNQLSTVVITEDVLTFADRTHIRNPKRVSSHYIKCLWECVLCYLRRSADSSIDSKALLQEGLEALQIGGVEWLQTIFNCFELLLPKILDKDIEMVEIVLKSSYRTLFENKPSISFWNAVDAFVQLAFQPELMSAKHLTNCLSNFAKGFNEKSESYHGIYLPLVKQVTVVWKDPLRIQSLLDHCEILVQVLVYGHNHRRDHKIVQDTEEFISSLGNSCSVNVLIPSCYLHDKEVRIEAILLLLKMGPDEMNLVVPRLVPILIDNDIKITGKKTRHFANSMIHRVKQRIWQTLLILEPFYTEEVATKIQQVIFDFLIGENLQLSVRYLMEWLVVKITTRFTNLLNSLWTAFERAASTRIGSLSSFLSIVYHLSGMIRNDKEEFLSTTIENILPFISVQHFNTRVYAQVTLSKIWQSCKDQNLERLLKTYRPIERMFASAIDTRHSGTSRNVEILNDDYYFSVFHPEKHFTIETVYYDLPRLTNVLEDEWLKPQLFFKTDPNLNDTQVNVPLFHFDTKLSRHSVGSWVPQCTHAGDEDLEVPESCGDIQKKPTPWNQMIPNFELLASSSESILSRKQKQMSEGLVVVASLVDKTPNLGGLCRTCEVFGVNRYVVGNLSHVQDKQFQSLSMVSDKWVPIQEVKVHELKDYLMECKKKGYTVIGVEQTANSSKMEAFKFPKKSVIVLGNEKEGISVEFIHLMDICIEIPQQGLIRSLNVHVTGAIIIWEYTKQHTLTST